MAISQAKQGVHYPVSDGKPIAETPEHVEAMLYLLDALMRYFAEREDVYVAGNQFMYWIEGNPSRRVAPDVYVVFGVPRRPWHPAWKVWETGKAPDVIFELTSRSTAPEDLGRKYRLYQRLGVKEYILIDVTREYLIEPVIQYRLVGQEYQQVPNERPNDREWRAHSELLGLQVVVRAEDEGYKVRLYDPLQRRVIPTALELAQQAADMEARLRELEAELQRRKEGGA
ncbi:MAG: Uma2 family endonuclease [Armatimonadota bacterium]|nr:Uma2 family endonuclease [bacterium]MDW8321596.1 Uma2 family endonuclease [Armatimonadota bacterium]